MKIALLGTPAKIRPSLHAMPPNPPSLLCDAHYHPGGKETFKGHAVLNGTSPEDWQEVLRLAEKSPRTIPAIGLHPWNVRDASKNWQEAFLQALDQDARAVGEIGLDRQFAEDSFEAQCEAFVWQLAQATARNLPVSIHCLKATDPLLQLLRKNARPIRGIHLHAYSGSAAEATQLVKLGAYVSFHAGQLRAPARKAPDALRCIPLDRLLIESDAPDTLPKMINHDAYLKAAYDQTAAIREIPLSTLTQQVMNNFRLYFLQ
jgi:TatD DNase family protein